jgi:hypothetical protein
VSDRRRPDADEPLPDWLLAELTELAEAFAHLPERARHAALKRNLSPRAHEEFDARVARRVRALTEGDER